MAVVKYKTKLYKPRQVSCILAPLFCKFATKMFVFQGVCSTWIASLEPSKGRNIDTEVIFFAVVDFFFSFQRLSAYQFGSFPGPSRFHGNSLVM